MKVEALKSYKMKNETWYSFFREVLVLINKKNSTLQLMMAFYSKILLLVDEGDEILQQQQKSYLTKEFVKANKTLLERYRALRGICIALTTNPDPEIANAAKRVIIRIDTYTKNVTAGSYLERDGAIQNILQDLDGPSHADVVLMNILNYVETMRTAYAQYWNLHQQRDVESSLKALGNLRAIISKTNKMYGMMKSQINNILALADMGDDFIDNSLISSGGSDMDDHPAAGEHSSSVDKSADAPANNETAVEKSAPAENARDYPTDAVTAYRFAVALNVIIWKYNTTIAQQAGRRKSRKKKLADKKKKDNKNNKKPGASS
jgi:hypothetical protein